MLTTQSCCKSPIVASKNMNNISAVIIITQWCQWKHNKMAAVCLEEGINPQRGSSYDSGEVPRDFANLVSLFPQLFFFLLYLCSPLLPLLFLSGSDSNIAHEWPLPYWQFQRQGTDSVFPVQTHTSHMLTASQGLPYCGEVSPSWADWSRTEPDHHPPLQVSTILDLISPACVLNCISLL